MMYLFKRICIFALEALFDDKRLRRMDPRDLGEEMCIFYEETNVI